MGNKYRPMRLGEEIRRIIGSMLVSEIKDPRLASRIITISGVEVTTDGSYATVYVAPLTLSGEDDNEVAKSVLTAFNSAKGVFRKRIASDIKLHHAPELIFKIDTSTEYGRHIDAILEEINAVSNSSSESEE